MFVDVSTNYTETDTDFDVVLCGDLDIATALDAFQQLRAAIDACSGPRILVDLTALAFADSMGLSALSGAYNYGRVRGRDVVLFNPSVRVRNVMKLSGLYDTIAVVDDQLV